MQQWWDYAILGKGISISYDFYLSATNLYEFYCRDFSSKWEKLPWKSQQRHFQKEFSKFIWEYESSSFCPKAMSCLTFRWIWWFGCLFWVIIGFLTINRAPDTAAIRSVFNRLCSVMFKKLLGSFRALFDICYILCRQICKIWRVLNFILCSRSNQYFLFVFYSVFACGRSCGGPIHGQFVQFLYSFNYVSVFPFGANKLVCLMCRMIYISFIECVVRHSENF